MREREREREEEEEEKRIEHFTDMKPCARSKFLFAEVSRSLSLSLSLSLSHTHTLSLFLAHTRTLTMLYSTTTPPLTQTLTLSQRLCFKLSISPSRFHWCLRILAVYRTYTAVK